MKIEIDQSGKIEQTSFHTVIADSVGNVLVLKAQTKRLLQQRYRIQNRPQMFVIETFAFMVARLIHRTYNPVHTYIIDKEYFGREDEIKAVLFRLFQRMNTTITPDQIEFNLVGKKSKAHVVAYKNFKNQNIPRDSVVNLDEILVFGP